MKPILGTLILLIFCQQVAGQNISKLESLNKQFEEIYLDSAQLARQVITEAIQLAEPMESSSLKARTYFNMGTMYYEAQDYDSASVFTQEAYNIALSVNDTLLMAESLKDLGVFAHQQNNLLKAQNLYLQSLKLAEIANLTDIYLHNLQQIGFIYIQEERLDEGYSYIFKNYEGRKKELTPGLVKATFNLANVLKRMGKPEESLAYLDTMMMQTDSLGFPMGELKAQGMRAYTLMDLKRLEEAEVSILKALKIARELSFPLDIFQLQLAKARLEQERKDFQAMEEEILETQKLLGTISNKEVLFEYYDAAYICYRNLNNDSKALASLEERSVLRDSIFNASIAGQKDELIAKYESEKKDQEIENLSQRAEIQELQLNQRNSIIIAGVILLIVLLAMAWLFYKNKTATNLRKISEVEQKVLRLQMNPHFIFNTLAVIQHMLLTNNPQKAGIYLAKFGKLMRQILEFSREDFIPLSKEVELLENYIELQKLSTGKAFDFEIKISDQIDREDTKIPPMFAQPFLENAIEHGKLEARENGKIIVAFERVDNMLELKISDNGVGVTNVSSKSGHKSLATVITRERLSLLSKEFKQKLNFSVEKRDQNDGGTLVTLNLPFLIH